MQSKNDFKEQQQAQKGRKTQTHKDDEWIMKKLTAALLSILMVCTVCFASVAEEGDELYERGREAFNRKDYGKAFELFSQSAELGNALGINALGAMYFDGYGVEQDTAKAADCFTKAGEAGNTDGWYNLGHMYITGAEGIEPDYAKSLEYFTKAADQGNEKGIYMIGYQYCKGAGVEQSFGKAYEYWCKAAKLGSFYAMKALGELYREGLGVEQDYEKAADLFWKSWTEGGEAGGYEEGRISYEKLIEEGKIPADYVPKDFDF